MSENLIEVSSFPQQVVVPSPGDPRSADSVKTPFQALANRTRWLRDHVLEIENRIISAKITGSNVGPGNRFTLEPVFNPGGFVVVNNSILCATNGLYFVTVTAEFLSSATINPTQAFGVAIRVNDMPTGYHAIGTRWSDNPEQPISACASALIEVVGASPTARAISFTAAITITPGNISIRPTTNSLVIVRRVCDVPA